MPYANTEAMQVFLDRFSATIADDEHVAMVLDQAGWHGAGDLRVPDNITLVPLPPYSPELEPGRARVALPQGALPLPSTARRLRRHCRRRLQRLEPPMRRGRAHHFAVLLSLDSTGQDLGGAVSYTRRSTSGVLLRCAEEVLSTLTKAVWLATKMAIVLLNRWSP